MAKEDKCQFIMEQKILILLLFHHPYAHKFLKQLELDTSTELKEKIESLSLILVKVLLQKEIFILH